MTVSTCDRCGRTVKDRSDLYRVKAIALTPEIDLVEDSPTLFVGKNELCRQCVEAIGKLVDTILPTSNRL